MLARNNENLAPERHNRMAPLTDIERQLLMPGPKDFPHAARVLAEIASITLGQTQPTLETALAMFDFYRKRLAESGAIDEIRIARLVGYINIMPPGEES